jgi:ppGpp synthetase/RelA/SpoT-type nucleotidyltranferase
MSPSQIHTWVDRFHKIQPRYEAFTGRLHDLLVSLLDQKGLKVHLVEKRTKSVESFRQKISRPDKKYTDPLAEVTDIAGIRIIVYDEGDVKPICCLIADEFDVDPAQSIDKLQELQPAEFGYRSVHFVVSLPSSRTSLTEWAHCAGLKGEIQVRSVFQHAWAVISHALEYKSEEEVPTDLRRRLHRLSALVELADQELSYLYAGLMEHVSQVDRDFAKGIPASDIDRTSLIKFLEKSPTVDKLIHIARSYGIYAGWGKGSPADDPVISELAWVCRQASINTTEELEALLADVVAKHHTYLSLLPSGHQMVGGFFILKVIVVARVERFIDVGPTYYEMLNGIMDGFLERFKRNGSRKPVGETGMNQ